MVCTKIRHETRDQALEHVKALVWKNHVAGQSERSAGLAAYPCEHCGAWHVGHQKALPLVWHYTVGAYLDAITESGLLKPAPARIVSRKELRSYPQAEREEFKRWLDEPTPLLWFSRNPEWEHSVKKTPAPFCGRAENELNCGGLIRFGVRASVAKLRWSDYLALNPLPPSLRDAMARMGSPVEWLATNDPVPLENVQALEVYFRGAWTPAAEVADEDFDRYLAERPAVYDAAGVSLRNKLVSVAAGTEIELTEAERIRFLDLDAEIKATGSVRMTEPHTGRVVRKPMPDYGLA